MKTYFKKTEKINDTKGTTLFVDNCHTLSELFIPDDELCDNEYFWQSSVSEPKQVYLDHGYVQIDREEAEELLVWAGYDDREIKNILDD